MIDEHSCLGSSISPDPIVQVQSRPTQTSDVIALNIVKKKGAVPFLDAAGEPRLRRKTEGPEDISWPIRSRQTKAWIACLYNDKTNALISRSSIDRVLLCLEGLAEDNDRSDIELCDIIETEPVLGLLIRHVRHEQQVKLVSGDLLNALTKLTKDSPHLRTRTWPESPEALGRRIRQLLPWIRKAGIGVEFIRDKHHRWISLRDGIDSSQTGLSPEPSSAKSFGDNTFQHSDSNDSSSNVDQEAEYNLIMNGELS
jgi:hypothetical protein